MSKLVEESAEGPREVRTRQAGDDRDHRRRQREDVLEVGKTEDGETYASDASRPMVFTVDTTLQGD